jgi:hypothetical protein
MPYFLFDLNQTDQKPKNKKTEDVHIKQLNINRGLIKSVARTDSYA